MSSQSTAQERPALGWRTPLRRLYADDQADRITQRTMPLLGVRLLVIVAITVLVSTALDPRAAVLWATLAVSAEAGAWLATSRTRKGLRQTPRQRAVYLAALLWMNVVWSGLGVALWLAEGRLLDLAAMALLATQLLHAQAFASRSPVAFAMVAGPPASAILLLAAADSLLAGWRGSAVIGGAVIMVSYMALAARTNARQLLDLEAAQKAAAEASEAKSAYLAFMSHELRTPLTGILGMADALRLQPDNPENGERVATLHQAARNVVDLLTILLEQSKLEAGELTFAREPFDLRHELESVVALWQPAAEQKGIGLRLEVLMAEDAAVIGDPARLRQIVNNLMGNAVKFTPSGEVSIHARVEAAPAPRLSVEVRDTGIGMSDAALKTLFRPFVQADPSIAQRFGGSGLGLSICRQLAEGMGGGITARSEIGKGSVFELSLPVELADTRTLALGPVDLNGTRVLLVDDNIANRQVGATLLNVLGCEVLLADDGDVAVTLALEAAPDLILMDLNMPRMGGREALRQLQEQGLDLRRHPVVALTAETSPDLARSLLGEGFAAVETKPIQLRRLAETILRVVQLSHNADRPHAPET